MFRIAIRAAVLALEATAPAAAEEFREVRDRTSFVSLLQRKQLTRLGIRLDVPETGKISGRAFGKQVSGEWRWQDGFFCRDLDFGQQDLGANCQAVKVDGDTVRFIADRGAGDHADLSLRQAQKSTAIPFFSQSP